MTRILASKPLFIPLKKEFFEAFLSGEKTVEYRVYGARWNEKVCFPGREAILSCRYGKNRRIKGIVKSLEKKPFSELQPDVLRLFPPKRWRLVSL